MKTTLNLRDDLLRKVKARAALRGQPLSRYIEEGLEKRLLEEETHMMIDINEWLKSLPSVSKVATEDLKAAVNTKDFRVIDSSMWQ